MKATILFVFLIVIIGLKSNTYAQDSSMRRTTRVITQGSLRLDTNKVIYDENGKALHYYQYQRYLNSGEYTIRYDGPPTASATKGFLVKLSTQRQNQMYEQMKKFSTIKSLFLQEGTNLNTKPLTEVLSNTELENKVVVLIFWNPECPPCTESFADINEFFKQIHNPEDLVILAITAASKTDAQAKLKEKPLLYAQFINSASSIYNAYELNAYPSYVVTDKNHTIRFASTGSSQITLPAFKSTIKAVLQQ